MVIAECFSCTIQTKYISFRNCADWSQELFYLHIKDGADYSAQWKLPPKT